MTTETTTGHATPSTTTTTAIDSAAVSAAAAAGPSAVNRADPDRAVATVGGPPHAHDGHPGAYSTVNTTAPDHSAAAAVGAASTPAPPTPPPTSATAGPAGGLAVGVPPITPPPPLPTPHRAPPAPAPLRDLPYRWLARVAVLGTPAQAPNGRPTLLTLNTNEVPTAPMPLPVMAREAVSGELITIGEVTRVYRTVGAGGVDEVCAAGVFDLGHPAVPAIVGELLRAAQDGRPATPTPQLIDMVYAPDAGDGSPEMLTAWRLAGLVLDQGPTWPGCALVPDEATVPVRLGGLDYPARRHHDGPTWRALVTAYRTQTGPGASAWERLNAAMAMGGAILGTAAREALARRVLDDHLPPAVLVADMAAALEAVQDDDARRGGTP